MKQLARVILSVVCIALLNALLVAIASLIDALVVNEGGGAFGYAGTFKVAFVYTAIFATLIGRVLAGPAWLLVPKLPKPKWAYLLAIGGLTAPLIIAALIPNYNAGSLLIFAVAGTLSAWCWYMLVERKRNEGIEVAN